MVSKNHLYADFGPIHAGPKSKILEEREYERAATRREKDENEK
jgi:hypothetical protein